VSEKDGTVVAACFFCDIKWTVKRVTPKALVAAGLTVMLVLPLHKAVIQPQPEIDVEIPTQPSQLSYATNGTATVVAVPVFNFNDDWNFR